MFRLAALFHLFALALLCAGLQRSSVASEHDFVAARAASPELAFSWGTPRAPLRVRLAEQPAAPVLAPIRVETFALPTPSRFIAAGEAPERRSRLVDRRELIRQLRRSQHRPPALADA